MEHNAWLCINPIRVVCVCIGTFVEKETLTLLFPRLNRERANPFPFLDSTWYIKFEIWNCMFKVSIILIH